jgi:hypothetical protein
MDGLISEYLDKITIGTPQVYKNLELYPLLSGYRNTVVYVTLDDALNQNFITVTEVCEGGLVPELKVVNKSGTMVLILDGEELIGAKQNRVVNTTILIAAGAETVIPVSCVEQGRWNYETREFRSEGRVMSSKIRSSKADQVKCSLRDSGRFASDQGAIWCDIEGLVQGFDVESPSTAMAYIYRKERPTLAEYAREFCPVDQQIGAVFVINGGIAGMDCFGKPETLEKALSKLVESYALDALEAAKKGSEPKTDSRIAVEGFLKGVRECRVESRPSVGVGTDCRLESNGVFGFALVHEGQLLHLSVFGRSE